MASSANHAAMLSLSERFQAISIWCSKACTALGSEVDIEDHLRLQGMPEGHHFPQVGLREGLHRIGQIETGGGSAQFLEPLFKAGRCTERDRPRLRRLDSERVRHASGREHDTP